MLSCFVCSYAIRIQLVWILCFPKLLSWKCAKFNKLERCAAGDKTIFGHLGLSRDRNMIDDRKLIQGIPALVQDLRDRSTHDWDCWRRAMTNLSSLMDQPNTALKELNFLPWLSRFPDYESHRKLFSQDLYAYFEECHPSAIPVCSDSTKASDQAEVY